MCLGTLRKGTVIKLKHILVTGINSYLGKSFSKYMEQFPEYSVTSISMRDGSWRSFELDGIDVVFHVAGLAHSDNGHISAEKSAMYYKINTELTAELAAKAKRAGVSQFIFMSSAIVYGDSNPIGKKRVITAETPCTPANSYGDSKLQAELRLKALETDEFKVVILRPPMIYGSGCKGNYPLLALLAKKLPVFPDIPNERSMLYVENLMEFVRLMIENEESGTFFPQNGQYSSTPQLVRMIAHANGKDILLTKAFNWLVRLLGNFTPLVDKAFGNLSYDMSMSVYLKGSYRKYSLEESIQRIEGMI